MFVLNSKMISKGDIQLIERIGEGTFGIGRRAEREREREKIRVCVS